MYPPRTLRIGIMLLAVVGLLSSVRPVSAQDFNCFGLQDKDCKILAAAQSNLNKSIPFNYEFETTVKYSVNNPATSGTFSAKGSGVFASDLLGMLDAEDQAAVLQSI